MHTAHVSDQDGHLAAFEISNSVLGRRAVAAIIQELPWTTSVRGPHPVVSRPFRDTFCEFEVGESHFEVTEPYGDSDVYVVGAAGSAPQAGTADLQAAFSAMTPPRLEIALRVVDLAARACAVLLLAGGAASSLQDGSVVEGFRGLGEGLLFSLAAGVLAFGSRRWWVRRQVGCYLASANQQGR
jgi:hypothetical protein